MNPDGIDHQQVSVKTMALGDLIPVRNGKVALTTFLVSVITCLVIVRLYPPSWLLIAVVLAEVTSIVLVHLKYILSSQPLLQVILCAHGLGVAFMVGIQMTVSGHCYAYFGYYTMALSFFHMSEYVVTSIFNSHTLSIDSFLLNHSPEYCVAAVASWVEFWIEYYFFSQFKCIHVVCVLGAVLVAGGEILRKLAMFTAGSNFTHTVQFRKRQGHQLVTQGVYSFFRHPSYVGWFYWSTGTQILLCNPICLVGYTIASWKFFEDRIHEEEVFLITFFGEDYVKYKKKVGTGIPFISGFPLDSPQLPKILEGVTRSIVS